MPISRTPLPTFVPALVLVWLLAACTTGPVYERPSAQAPDDWSNWRSGDPSLRLPADVTQALPTKWWLAFQDPVLNQLQERAVQSSPDLRTAMLHFAQARAQRSATDAQRGPDVNVSGSVGRQRQSEYGAGTRMVDALGGNRERLADFLGEPFTLYQTGFDASWELDLWGRVRRSIEAADADVQRQAALLDLARLSLTSDVTRHYLDLRTTQRQIKLAREDIAVLQERLDLQQARAKGGVIDHLDLERQRAELLAVQGRLPGLLAQEGSSVNQIALLLGQRPGSLQELLAPVTTAPPPPSLPDLALGLPSEVALRRPDIRAAEAQLHRATASIGVAQAELYPSVRLGAKFGYESYLQGEFIDWGSRTWSVGPSMSLPLFDHGRRKSIVQLRELEQQEAAVNYQRTVLQAWQEIDDALNSYAAERQQEQELQTRRDSLCQAYELSQARYKGGATDLTSLLDSQRAYLQAQLDLVLSQGQLSKKFIVVNKVLGNVPAAD